MNIGNKRGITLVALVITIIILLILAGVSIQAITNTGLFENAKKAQEKSMEGQLKEEINLAIQEVQVEEISKGNGVTLETLAVQLESKLQDIECTLENDEITGEYKDYEYTINSNLEIAIEGPVSGIRIKGNAEIQTTGYVFEGSVVEIKVTASITDGTITGIEAPEGATLKTDTSITEKVYTVNKNGEYIFKITGENAKVKKVKAKVENILSKPQINVDEIKKDSFKINVENDYPEGVIAEYKYYVGGTIKKEGTQEKNYTVTGLTKLTKYSNIKVVAYVSENVKGESNSVEVTTKDNVIEYSWDEIAEIAKAISNDTSITENDEKATVTVEGVEKTLNVGDKTTLDGKTVRILGFNHDILAEPDTAYDLVTETGKAGISFEYVDFLTTSNIRKNSDINSGGWAVMDIRTTLNNEYYNALSIKNKIKKVKKEYISYYSSAPNPLPTTDDYLWLLSCGEIKYNSNDAVAMEGSQYKYYKINSGNLKKPSATSPGWWLTRTPYRQNNYGFLCITDYGSFSSRSVDDYVLGVTPGFSI